MITEIRKFSDFVYSNVTEYQYCRLDYSSGVPVPGVQFHEFRVPPGVGVPVTTVCVSSTTDRSPAS